MGTEILRCNTKDDALKQQHKSHDDDHIGSGMDCAVIPLLRHNDLSLVQTVDFFYPLVDDPYVMGKIALANVVSDVYAVGVTHIDQLNMLITAPTELSDEERNIIIPMVVQGFSDAAKLAGCSVNIQSMVLNPWCIIGGIASAVAPRKEIIMPSNAEPGDLLVLTKPLGTQLATNAFIWMQENHDKHKILAKSFNDDVIKTTFEMAIMSMTYLNKNAALLMQKYDAHGATDVTGFGILGHAKNLADFQKAKLIFKITTLPIIKNVLSFAKTLEMESKLIAGKAVETSGGLLICLPAKNAAHFCSDFHKVTAGEQSAWIVGKVEPGEHRDAVVVDDPQYIEVEF